MNSYKRVNQEKADTWTELLAAAGGLFAERGFDGTSVRAITQAAGANLGAVTYHFGSKRELYDAVVRQTLERFAESIERAARAATAPGERLGGIVQAIFAFFQEFPKAPRLVLRELLAAGGPPPTVVPYARRILAAIGGVVREGQGRGEFRPIDPVLVVFTLLSQCIWFALVRRQLAVITGVPLDRPEQADLMAGHISDVVARAVAAEAS